ncbi:MAG: histidine kinase dimerization/phosphoacceptor domain -containing protein [Candidatus Thermoplasmatota archaeon]
MKVTELYVRLTNLFIDEISEEIGPDRLKYLERDLMEESPLLFDEKMFDSQGRIMSDSLVERANRLKGNQGEYLLRSLRYFNKRLVEVYGEEIMPLRAYEKYNECYQRVKRNSSDEEPIRDLLTYLPEDTAIDDKIDESLQDEMKKKFRRRLRQFMESKNRYKLLFDSIGQPVFVIDLDFNLVEMNPATSALFRQDDYKIVGSDVRELKLFEEEDLSRFYENVQKVIDKEERSVTQTYQIDSGGEKEKRTLEITSTGLSRQDDILLVINVCRDITQQLSMKRDLEESLEEKKVLLQEIHHRVKNNMQIILSMLDRQARYFENQEMDEILNETRNRIMSMSMVHNKLYRSENMARIDFSEYCEALGNQVINTYKNDDSAIRLQTDIEDVSFDIDTLIPLGLIITELVSNSMKHAFEEGEKGKIGIEMNAVDNVYKLVVKDDGKGPPSQDYDKLKRLGLSLVEDLVDQLDGDFEFSEKRGFRIQINIPREDQDERKSAGSRG